MTPQRAPGRAVGLGLKRSPLSECVTELTEHLLTRRVLSACCWRSTIPTMIASGTEWTRTVCSMPKKTLSDPTEVTVQVDAPKFADGASWGPPALRESHQLVGALDGMDFIAKTTELQRFVSSILPERGPAPLENIQTQTIAPHRVEPGAWREEDRQDMLAVAVTNESNTPIRGYLFNTSFLIRLAARAFADSQPRNSRRRAIRLAVSRPDHPGSRTRVGFRTWPTAVLHPTR
jgi:hypothetical protein